jgi:hypothetical protein
MGKRGRKSAAELSIIAVDGKPPRLEPPVSLSEAERTVFTVLVAACDTRRRATCRCWSATARLVRLAIWRPRSCGGMAL